jgi:hypothetical protein
VEVVPLVLFAILALLVAALAVFAAATGYALFKGCFELRRNLRAAGHDLSSLLLKSPIVPGVSVVYAAPDASPESRSLVRRLLDLHFGRHELVLVLDGPSNAELEQWIEELHLFRQERIVPLELPSGAVNGYYLSRDPVRLLVVVKQAGGLADALNAGVNAAQYPVIGLVDREADFIPELLLRLIRPMLADWERVVAVCGVAPPFPAPGFAGRIGAIETSRLWLARCAAFSGWNRLLPVPGACMLVKRDAICSVSGFRAGLLELFLDLHNASQANYLAWRFALLAAPVSCRPAARTWEELGSQLESDQRQLATALGRPGVGGGRAFFGLYSVRALRPLLETAAYILAAAGWLTGLVSPALAGLVLVTGIGSGIVNSMAAVVLRELAAPSGVSPGYLAALFLTTVPENLGYRQIRNVRMVADFFGTAAPQNENRGHAVEDRAPAIETLKKY